MQASVGQGDSGDGGVRLTTKSTQIEEMQVDRISGTQVHSAGALLFLAAVKPVMEMVQA